jgi:AraC family transcriptional regulator
MEWSERMNAAVNYIEDNLTGEVDFEKAADQACCSLFHFQRMFYAIIGVTPAEYTRRRRLTLAARELTTNGSKVIDVALKYGYDSPEAFSRAFRKLHGIAPLSARTLGTKLATCARVSFHIEIKGDNDMDYKLVEVPAFDLVGTSHTFNVSNGEIYREGTKVWTKYVATKEYQTLWDLNCGKWGPVSGAPLMSVYLANENGTWDPIVNAFGVERVDEMDMKGFRIFHIPVATYAEFNCTIATSTETNKRIYSEWFPSTGYEHDTKPDIEAYFQVAFSPVVNVRWWVPVVKKNKK